MGLELLARRYQLEEERYISSSRNLYLLYIETIETVEIVEIRAQGRDTCLYRGTQSLPVAIGLYGPPRRGRVIVRCACRRDPWRSGLSREIDRDRRDRRERVST